MISVCIPVYNLDVRNLVNSLLEQAGTFEIILIDDGSDEKFRKLNRELTSESGIHEPVIPVSGSHEPVIPVSGSHEIHYHELPENVGRARIRNLFLSHARFSHLLFLDCDTVIVNSDYMVKYTREIEGEGQNSGGDEGVTNNIMVICGGTIYSELRPERSQRLHWKYGKKRVSRSAKLRNRQPDRSFMTNNFLVSATVLRNNPFPEEFRTYGHEDTLFGYHIGQKGIPVRHIDNPVLHRDLQTNREFVDKTNDAVENLVRISAMLEDDPQFVQSITLLGTVRALERMGIAELTRLISRLMLPVTRILLRNGCTSLRLLDFYKLGLFLTLRRKKRRNKISNP